MLSDSCAICEKDGVFQVEDLPVGIRKFCSEKCFAQYTGLPVQKEGYYGMSKSPTEVPQQQNAENKGKNKINPIEKAEISGMASGATMEGLSALMGAEEEDFEAHALILPLLLAEEEPPEKDDPLESWMEDYDAEESAYWFLKGEMQSRAPLTEMDLEQILEMLQNVPAKEMNEAMEQADMMGDEAAMIVLIMANNKRKFREQFASEGVEELSAYFAKLKTENPELARKIEFSVKNEDELPEKEIMDNGYDLDRIEEWVDLVGIEDENLQPYESCATCEGEGIIVTNYYPATRYDPPDIDYIPCEECIDGEYDPAYYMDKEGQYYAESFEADTNGDRQLEESIKRTKMSAIRTGLAITTFGIVLWNLWTNKKQEKQISDIMGLV